MVPLHRRGFAQATMPVICIVFCALCARNDAKLWARCIKNPVQGKYVDFTYENRQGTINLDFTAFDATSAPEDTSIVYNTTECNVHIALSTLESIIHDIGSENSENIDDQNTGLIEDTVEYSAEFDTHFTFDTSAAEKVEATGGVDFVDGELVITADGSIDLTDGEDSLHINIGGLSALKEELLESAGVSIEVIEGQVPLGSEASYEAHTEAETAELVEQYITPNAETVEESTDQPEVMYSAADLKIVRDGEDIGAEGLFQVTVDKESLVPAGMKLEKLYHIHDGIVDELAVEETEGGLVFEVANFSDLVASYTVDFEYNGYTWSWPGLGRYAIADILSEIGVDGEIDDVDLLRVVDEGGAEDVLYLSEDKAELISDGAFWDTFRLTVKVENTPISLDEEEVQPVKQIVVITITDDTTTFTSTIKFFAEDAAIVPKTSSTPMHIEGNLEAPELTKNNYLLATLYDNDDNKIGWKLEPVTVPENATSVSVNFSSFYRFEEDLLPGNENYGTSTTQTVGYSATQNKVETRLYRFDYPLNGTDLCYNKAVKDGDDRPEDGYEFGGNFVNSQGINEIHLKKATSNKKYYVRVRFDEEAATAFTSGDCYYVNVKVTHASTVDSFQGGLLEVDPASLQTDSATGLRYIDFDFTQWKNGAGTDTTGSFTGYEDSILVELIHQNQNEYKPGYDSNDAAPVPEGTLAKAYRVHYDTKQTNPKDTPTGFYEDRDTDHVYCYDYIDMMTVNATDDYSYSTILGPNMGYGIVADHLFQGNDLQTNFAVNHYSAHGHYVSPDLSGNSSGAIVIGEFNVVDGMAENGTGAAAYDDTWGRLPIGNVLDNTLIVYADNDTGYNAPDGNVSSIENKAVVVVHTNGEDLKSTMVQPGINYGIAMSNALMSHPDTFTPPLTSTTQGTVDTTGFADGATIYVDGDNLATILATSGGLTIKKKENQTIVFNFDTTRDLTITQFKVEQYSDAGTKLFELTTSTDTAHGTEQNNKMDQISRHLVWNLNGVKGKTTLKEVGGIFLQPNRNSEIDIAATSGGWIVSNGFVYNSSAEWHNFYADMPDTNKLNLRAIKTVDGKIPRAGQKFEFFLKEYNSAATDESEKWTLITTQRNTNANVSFPEMHDLSEGWHVYKIHENTVVPTGEGIEAGQYIVDQSEYYALVHVEKTSDSQGTRYIITPPTYYKGPFDESKFDKDTGAATGTFGEKVSSASFDNEAVKEGLTIEKKVTGTTDTTKRFTFEVELKNAGDEPLTGPHNYTVTGIAGTKTLTLNEYGKGEIVLRNGQKATIEGLPVGTKYTVTETKVGTKVISDTENQDLNGYVDGYQTPANAISEEIEADNIAIASFTNVYHAAGSVSLKAKKVMHNAEGEEVELQDQQFRFTLTPLNSAVATPETVLNDAQGNVTFSTLSFTEADMTGAIVLPNGTRVKTLIYYVTESDGELTNFNYGNVTYDSNKVVLITLTDDGEGHITAKSNVENFTVGINNTYELKAPAALEGNKKLTGRDMAAGEFSFTARLYKTNIGDEGEKTIATEEILYNDQNDTTGHANPAYVTEVHGTPTKLTAKNAAAEDNGANPPVSTSALTFPTVYYMDAGVYYYQITEDIDDGDLPMGVTAKDPTKTYYAKVTVPAVAGRTNETVSTVEYYSDAACTVSIPKANVVFENEQENLNFTVTKSWTNSSGTARNEGYSIVFSVKQNGRAYPITAKHLEIVSGDASQVEILSDGTVKLTGNASGWPVVRIKNVPEATYVVTETLKMPAEGDTSEYNTTYTVGSKTTANHATVTENDSTVSIYNTQGDDKYTSITVEKKWMAGETEYTPTEGEVTFQLTKTEKKQVEATGGKKVYLKINDDGGTVTQVTAGNKIVVTYQITFSSANDKKSFYEQYANHKIYVQYSDSCDGSNFNGNATNGNSDNEIKIASPANISAEDRAKIETNNDTAPITATFEIPTKGSFTNASGNSVAIDGSKLQGVHIKNVSWSGNGTRTYNEWVEEPTYDTVTTTTTSTFAVDAEHGWRTVLSGLPLSKSSPVTSYTYTVEEISVNGKAVTDSDSPFTVTYSGDHEDIVGGTVVATNTKDTVMVTVNKQWKFPNGSTTWPEGVTVSVKLQDKGKDVAGKTATLDAEHPSAIFDDLDKEGVYTVVETGTTFTGGLIKLISGDATNGFTITNYATDTDVTVQKTWDTDPTEDWTATFKLQKARVAKIAVDGALLATPEAVATETWTDVDGQDNITISKASQNPVTLSDLPVAEEDDTDPEHPAVYSLKYRVVETNLTIGSDTITNRIDPETGDFRFELVQVGEAGNSYAIIANNKVDDTKTSLTVNKVWQGGNPPADASIAVTLGRFKLVEQQPSTITITDSHSGLLSGDTYSVQYTISGGEYVGQTVTSGMSVPAGTYTIAKTVTVDTNRYTTATNISETREITVSEGEDASVSFNETVFTPITGTLTISDDYTGAPNGYSVSYRITGPYGYDQTTTATSVPSLPKGAYTVAKSVTAPSGYTITSNATDTQTVEVDCNGGTATMAKTEFEEQVVLEKHTVNIYSGNGDGTKNNNCNMGPYTYDHGTEVTLIFNCSGNSWVASQNPNVHVYVNDVDKGKAYPNGEAENRVTFTLNGDVEVVLSETGYNNFGNVTSYMTVEPAQATSNALTSNRLSAPRTLSKGASRGLMANAAPATTTGEVTVTTTTIIVNNSAADPTYSGYNNVTDSWSKEVTLNNGNSWSAAADMLPKADAEGHEYVYYIASVTETNVPTGTTAVITTADGKKQVVRGNHADGDNATLSLTDTLPKTSISANKTWVHGANPQASQPTSVKFTLYEDGVSKGEKRVTSDNDWTVTWDDLELYKADGTKHSYSVTEENVTDYVLTSTTYDSATQTFKLTNTYTPTTTELPVNKVWAFANGSTAWPEGVTVTVTLYKSVGGAEAVSTGLTKQLTAANTSDTFTDLPLKEGDKNVTYSVRETGVTFTDANNFTTSVNGTTITNTEKKGNLSLTKVVTGTTDATKEFTFYVTLNARSGGVIDGSYATVKQSVAGTQAVTGGTAFTVTLKAGETWRIDGLPVGATWTVTEDNLSGYTFKGVVAEGNKTAIEDGATVKLTATNVYEATTTFQPKVQKTFTNGNFANNSFSFTLTEVDSAESTQAKAGTTPQTVTVNSGTAKAFEAITYDQTIFGEASSRTKTYYYTIAEQLPNGLAASYIDDNGIQYDPTMHRIQVTVTDNGAGELVKTILLDGNQVEEASVVAAFTNVQLGKLEITKRVEAQRNDDKAGTFWYAVFKAEDVEEVVSGGNTTRQPKSGTHTVRTGSIVVTTDGTETVTEDDLPYGEYYVFELAEAPTTVNDTSENLKIILGGDQVIASKVYTVTGSGTTAATVNATAGKATLTNTVPETDFDFTKEWLISGSSTKQDNWPGSVTIPSFTLERILVYNENGTEHSTTVDSNFSVVFSEVGKEAVDKEPNASSKLDDFTNIRLNRKGTGNDFIYTVSNLPKYGSMTDNGTVRVGEWKYRVKEAQVSGYNAPVYLTSEHGATNNQFAEDGGIIQNYMITVALPATGGMGTGVVYGAGAALLLLAVLGLILLNRKRTDGEGIR